MLERRIFEEVKTNIPGSSQPVLPTTSHLTNIARKADFSDLLQIVKQVKTNFNINDKMIRVSGWLFYFCWRAFSSSVVSRNVQALNLSNVLHGQDYQYVTFYPRKTRKSRQFWQQLKNGGCFTHIF